MFFADFRKFVSVLSSLEEESRHINQRNEFDQHKCFWGGIHSLSKYQIPLEKKLSDFYSLSVAGLPIVSPL